MSQKTPGQHRLSIPEMRALSDRWEKLNKPNPEGEAFYNQLQVSVRMEMPLGELANPKLAGFVWALGAKGITPETGEITNKNSFNAQGLEGKVIFRERTRSGARLLSYDTGFDRINIFV